MERRPTRFRVPGREGWSPGWIVIHTTDGTYAATCTWFDNPSSGVSAHYLVGLDGRVAQFVEEEDAALHAGGGPAEVAALRFPTPDPNLHTIGIEFEDGGAPLEAARTPAQYRTGAALLADVAGRWGIPLDREHVLGHRELNPGKDCPGNLDLERLIAAARDGSGPGRAGAPLLAVLLPVRNAAADLPGWLESVGAFADTVVALDDGSTDETAELLEASPLVETLLRNPVREGYAGWDDAANRQRLLDAAAELSPAWVLFLDADERLDAEDGRALREFLESGDALPACAYGLEMHRTWGEPSRVAGHTIVYRLFAPVAGQRLPERRLHFNPVPDGIPRGAWLRTTIRARHLDSPDRLGARLSKYADADPDGSFERLTPRLLDRPAGELRAWTRRPPGLGVLDVAELRAEATRTQDAALLAVLLPVRNAAADLPGWLESVGAFADTVVALDDGSTDETAELLEASPLVETLLRNPVREGYAGWDDAANRQRLLDAAAELSPAWVLFLDADERLDAEDGRALREFLEEKPDPRNAYGFRVFRMAGDENHYDQAGLWVYRLFSPRPGATLPPARLHLVPVPADIPRERWRDTTFRIRHLAGLDEDRRRRRFAKYEDADPDRLYQRDYSNLLEQGLERRPWIERPPGLPALADPLGRGARIDLHDLDLDAPVLSAIVISRDDEDRIERCVASVADQRCEDPFEVIVVVSGSDRTAEIVRERFPEVTLIELPRPALPGEARNAGLAVARGDYVSFPGSHIELPPGSLAARIRAHSLGYGMVTGTVVNGTESRAGWASYFLDHSNVLPGRPSGELKGPPSHCSYVRDFVLEAGGFPEDMRTGEDTVVNNALWRRGLRAYRAADVHLVHKSPCEDVQTLVRHHFRRGRGLGRILCDRARNGRPLLRPAVLRTVLLGYVPTRLRRTRRAVSRWGADLMPEYRRSRRLIAIGTLAAWAGTWFEILRPASGKLRILLRGGRGG